MVLDLPVRLVDMLLAFTLRHMDGRVQDSLAAAERKRMAVLVQPCRDRRSDGTWYDDGDAIFSRGAQLSRSGCSAVMSSQRGRKLSQPA